MNDLPDTLKVREDGIEWSFSWYPGGITAAPGAVPRSSYWCLSGPGDLSVPTPIAWSHPPRKAMERNLREWLIEWLSEPHVRELEIESQPWSVRRTGFGHAEYAQPGCGLSAAPVGLLFVNGEKRLIAIGVVSAGRFVTMGEEELRREFNRALPLPPS